MDPITHVLIILCVGLCGFVFYDLVVLWLVAKLIKLARP